MTSQADVIPNQNDQPEIKWILVYPDHVGRTYSGRFTYRSLFEPDFSVAPNCLYWRGLAEPVLLALVDELGPEAYEAWCDEELKDDDTWMVIHEKACAALVEVL